MLYQTSGTSVPPSLDSPFEGGNFKVKPKHPPKKPHILAVSLRPLPNLEFEVTVARLYKKPRVYLVGPLSANRLVNVINVCRHDGRANICPSTIGWTAFLDIPVIKPVYPPPGGTA